MRYLTERRTVIDTARRMNDVGLNQGTSGNVSLRTPGGFLITPTGMPYELLGLEDIVDLRADGSVVGQGGRLPSSEWRIHRDIYAAREEAGAVVHAHPMFSTTLAINRMEIPAVHYMIAVAGGNSVRCAGYATFGSEELSRLTLLALLDRKACLMANHGLIALGRNLGDALKVATEIENLAAQYWRALQVGRPVVLDDAEMERVIEKFKSYGQQRSSRANR
jgi:L-fuculose-phosphate aldolase